MSWQFVFNTRHLLAGQTSKNDAVCLAMESNYKFILWNGDVYFITRNGTEDTGIKSTDLY